MKHKRWIALLLAAILAVGAMSATAFAANSTEAETEPTTEEGTARSCPGAHGRREKIAEPENAIGKDAAKETALADSGVSAEEAGKVKARITRLEDGAVVYRVSFTAGELWYCCRVDALTGEILDKTTEDAAAHAAAKAERKAQTGKSGETGEDGTEPAGRGHHRGGKHGAHSAASDAAASEEDSSL